MSSDSPSPTPPAPKKDWPALNLEQRRILGVLVEKAKTTPDAYPLSMNSVLTGCNQKSNRDPMTNFTDFDVEEALISLQKLGLTIRITGSGRVERWRHNIYDAWELGKIEAAIVAELLLRGPQTEGELRGRASRMEEIGDLDTLRSILAKLKERKMILYLTPEGKRGTIVTHGFYPPGELQYLRKTFGSRALAEESAPLASPSGGTVAAAPMPVKHAVSEDKVTALETALADSKKELGELRAQVEDLRATVNQLAEELKALRESLGG